MGIPCCAWRGRTSSVHSNRSCTCLYADRTVCRYRPTADSRTQRGVIVRPGVRAPPDSSMHRPVAVRHRPARARLLPSRVLSSKPANRFQCPTGSARNHARSRLLPSARHRVPVCLAGLIPQTVYHQQAVGQAYLSVSLQKGSGPQQTDDFLPAAVGHIKCYIGR